MKRFLATSGAAVLLLLGTQAQAAEISFGSTTITGGACTSNINSNFGQAQVTAQITSCFGAPSDPLTLLYKQNVGGTEEGTFSGSYTTTFWNQPLDPADGKIAYAGGNYMDCLACYLVVKDGNHSPAQYFFNISNWNGIDTINLSNFWPQQGAISNVAIWGSATTVPEPASLLLIGSGLGLAALKRRRRAA